jgi:osmoprotectant transport system permease protein
VDVIDGYSTDGLIARYDLTVLEDDRGFFPPYEAAALVGRRLADEAPAAVAALTRLSGRMDVAMVRRWNQRVEVENEPVDRVATDALRELGLTDSGGVPAPGAGRSGFLSYLVSERGHLLSLTGRHLLLVALSLLAAIVIAVPLGLVLTRLPGGAETAVRGVGLFQTIPSIALLAFMIPLLGIGVVPALVALFLYSLYPILRNTYSGLRQAGSGVAGPATALGMTPSQVLRYVRLPLAAPVIMAGIRTAAVINVGTATLAAFIGAGGLGDPIVAGLALSDPRMILSGAIPAALLALLVDGVLALVEWSVRPRGL